MNTIKFITLEKKDSSNDYVKKIASMLITKALNPLRAMCVIDPTPVILNKFFPKDNSKEES